MRHRNVSQELADLTTSRGEQSPLDRVESNIHDNEHCEGAHALAWV